MTVSIVKDVPFFKQQLSNEITGDRCKIGVHFHIGNIQTIVTKCKPLSSISQLGGLEEI